MTELSVGKRVQQRGTQVCRWCTEKMSKEAINCPHCGKARKDIYTDTVLNNTFAVGMALCGIIWIAGMSKRAWHTFHANYPDTPYYSFNIGKFLSSVFGIFLLISFVVCLIATIYYAEKVKRKRRASFWAS